MKRRDFFKKLGMAAAVGSLPSISFAEEKKLNEGIATVKWRDAAGQLSTTQINVMRCKKDDTFYCEHVEEEIRSKMDSLLSTRDGWLSSFGKDVT